MPMNSTTALLAAFAIAAATTAACSSDDPEATTTTATNPSGTGGSGQGGATTSAGGSSTTTMGAGAGGEGPVCEAPRPPHPGNTFMPGTVTASFTDQDGGAAGDMIVDLCGTNICLVFGTTDANGDVTLPGGDGSADDPALLYGDGKTYAKLAGQILPNEVDKAYGAVNALRYPTALGSGSLLAEGANEDNGVTLTIPAGSVIDVDGLIYDNPSQATFRVAVESLDGGLNLPGVDPNLNLEVILAMAPIDTVICPGAGLSFPNTEGWDDGAEVELFIHGTKIGGHYAPYTQWAKVAEATVQGNDVVTKDGEVIELIGTYGARLKP